MNRLYLDAISSGPEYQATRMFWAKTRRRMHEVQRIVHGFDPSVLSGFVKQCVALLRRELPEKCPACNTNLGLSKKVAEKMRDLSIQLDQKRPPSEIVPIEASTEPTRGEAPAGEQGKG